MAAAAMTTRNIDTAVQTMASRVRWRVVPQVERHDGVHQRQEQVVPAQERRDATQKVGFRYTVHSCFAR